uniref:Peptidyl-prolyl cis-trans isomerase n=1 Tax=Hirondellea gigas TaxID=1518452 RepID=A0A6A7G6Y3_9CRUS
MDSKADEYQPPSWACEPSLRSCCLKVTKNGSVIDKVRDVSQQICTVFGRNVKLCDVILQHPSISRQHASILHGSSGNMYIIDLGSSHGTFINKKRLDAKRRQVLRDHDKIRFGASTRTYVVVLKDDDWDEQENFESHSRSNGRKRREKDRTRTFDRNDRRSKRQKQEKDLETVRCRHILVKHIESRRPKSWKDMAVTRSKEDAMDMVKDYREQINSREVSFVELAKKESDCNSHSDGGDLGRFGRGKMQKPFEEAAFNLAIDELSYPIETQSGIHLILRTE